MSNVIYNYHQLCQDVKKLDEKIRFVGVINEQGRLVTSELKKNGFFVSEKDDEMVFMELALRVRMRRDFEDKLGRVKYSMTVREGYVGMNFPIKTDFLYVAVDPDVDILKIIQKIIKRIKFQGEGQLTSSQI